MMQIHVYSCVFHDKITDCHVILKLTYWIHTIPGSTDGAREIDLIIFWLWGRELSEEDIIQK